ncbi:hypothetical protein HALLA_13355 [Halostagnicola larsenii XH-48]|uniref:Uncharacterized protein n=1 Tax=Halostagnicola larsenii XH-48 TaxID=797299 RepID=W0JQL4_9EURY|nr:hypothetical protein HALLA_13355 [Halostagnicola larsenii XH-48]
MLGATLYGVYTYAQTLIQFFMVFARLGTGKSILRFLPEHSDNPPRRDWTVRIAYLTALAASILISAGLYILAPLVNSFTLSTPELVIILRILAIALPFNTLINLTGAIFRGLERVELQIIVQDFTKPLIQIAIVAVAFVFGFSLVGVVTALAVGTVLTFSVAISILYNQTDIRPTGDLSSGSFRRFYNFSLPLTFKDLGSKLYTRVDILMVGFFLTGSAVGIYRISVLMTSFLTLPLSGINQLFPPVASDLHSNGERKELEEIYQILTRWTFTIVIPPALAVIVFSQEVLQIFGEGFSTGSFVLILFAVAQLTNCLVGPSGFLLMMTDHQYLNLANQWTLGVSNVVLNYVLILEFGFIGAAVATAGSLAMINVIRVVEVWHFEGMIPYSTKFWKPVFAGILTIPVMLGLEFYLTGYVLLVVGSTSGLLVFVTLLVMFGFEDEDKEFYYENVRPYMRKLGIVN